MENRFAGLYVKMDCVKNTIAKTAIVSVRETRNLARHDLTHEAINLIWTEMAKQNPAATDDTLDRNVDMVVETLDDMLKAHNVSEYRIGNILYHFEVIWVKPAAEHADNRIKEKLLDRDDIEIEL